MQLDNWCKCTVCYVGPDDGVEDDRVESFRCVTNKYLGAPIIACIGHVWTYRRDNEC